MRRNYYDAAPIGAMAKFGIKVTGPSSTSTQMHGQTREAVKRADRRDRIPVQEEQGRLAEGPCELRERRTSVKVGDKTVTAKNIIIATGSSVTPLPGVEVDNDAGVIVDSTGALELPKVPEHMVVIGGGVIGLELGSVWRRLGAKVTVVEFLDQILPGMDEDSAQGSATRSSRSRASTFKTRHQGHRRERRERQGAALTVEPAKGGDAETIEADVVLVSIGRRPNTDGLGLDKVGLAVNAARPGRNRP